MNCNDILKSRNALFGISAVWIVLFHINGFVGIPIPPSFLHKLLSIFFSFGNTGVDVFLFLSSIGLLFSLKKNSIKDYYVHRLKRIMIPYLLIGLLFYLWYDFVFMKDGIVQFILNWSTLNCWISGQDHMWYISFIVVAYALFPLLYYLDDKTNHLSTVVMIVGCVIFEMLAYHYDLPIYANCERALSRIPVFLVGLLLGDFAYKNKRVPKPFIFAITLIGIGTAWVTLHFSLPLFIRRYMLGVSALGIICFLGYCFDKSTVLKAISVPFAIVGKYSLEVYLVHISIILVINYYSKWESFDVIFWWITIIIGTIIVSFLLSKVNEVIWGNQVKKTSNLCNRG